MSFTIFQNKKSPFQAIKTRSSKSRNTATFPKGLTHCFGPKIAIYPTSSFQVKEIRKMSFTIFQNEKTPRVQGIKTRRSNSRKIAIFLNGLTHGFGPKMAFFPTSFFFQAKQARKMSFTIFYTKKTPSQAIKTRNSKSRKIDIFLKGLTDGFGPKMAIFLKSFFRQYRPRKCFLRYSKSKKRLFRL